MIRNKKNEARAANKAANKARKEREKAERKRKIAADKAAKSPEKANAKKQRQNASRVAAYASRQSFIQSSTPNDGLETNTLSVANPGDGNNNLTPAPPTITLVQNEGILNNLTPANRTNTLLQNEGILNNLTPAPPTISLLHNEDISNNETPAPPNTSLPQNEATSQLQPSHPEAQINIGNNLASDFASESEPLTFEQTLKNIKLGIKPTLPLHLHPKTIDLQNKFNEKSFKHKVNHCLNVKE